MNFLMILLVSGLLLHDTTAVSHSLKYFYTASSGVKGFPEFVAVGMVDDAQMIYYDSNTQTAEPKQDWISRVTEEDPQYLVRSRHKFLSAQYHLNASIETLKQRFSQTGGVHIFQRMYGCEWDDETGEVDSGFFQYGYDGEDFISFDLSKQTWTAAKQQAVITKQSWDNDRDKRAVDMNYHTRVCPEWLKKYVNYGNSTLMRTDLPSVSLLQKSPSSPVTCHASGFYPNSAMMFWRKDGEELQNVYHADPLPNHDGSFQMSVDLLKLPSDDWGRYECVFQLAGVKEDQVTKLNKDRIRTNHAKSGNRSDEVNAIFIVLMTTAVILLSNIVCVAGFFIHKKRNVKRPPSPSVYTCSRDECVMLQKD